jgi:hypothetical protein
VTARWAGSLREFSVRPSAYHGAITVRVRAYDRAGNVAYTPARTWRR